MGIRLPLLLVCTIAIVGCATDPAQVEDRSLDDSAEARPPVTARNTEGGHRVVRGDTLYAIAFTRGLDYRDVAAWNGISAPYTILVGQELRLTPPNGTRPVAAAERATLPPKALASASPARAIPGNAPAAKNENLFEDVPSQFAPPAGAQREASQSTAPTSTADTSSLPSSDRAVREDVPASPVPSTAPAAIIPPAPPQTVAPPPVVERQPETPAKPVAEGAVANVNGIAWRWPSNGKVLGGFVTGDQTRQGVDIAGSAGDPVRSAADGEVVYSGNGLIGYGELIIVKHNASFLSAYGHNRKRLVQEGEKVRAGQQIAEMGSSASSRDELHFEIRKNGKPVNPMDFLPAR